MSYPRKKNAFLLLLAVLVFSCKKSGTIQESTIRISNGTEPESLDPHISTGLPGIRVIGALFEGLTVRRPETGGIGPGIAKNWEISEDGLYYTFHLRTSFWSDGLPLLANDFVVSWRRLIAPTTGAEYGSLLNILKNAQQILSGKLPLDSLGVHAEDDSTLEVELSSPTPYFLHLCAFEPLHPVPIRKISQYGEKWTRPENIANNGPYLLNTWEPNKIIRLKRNPKYWDAEAVKQKAIDIYPIEDQETAYKMYLNDELDWLFSVPLSKISSVKSRQDYVHGPQYGVYYYALNMKHADLKNQDLRKALFYSLDREKITQFVTKGNEIPAMGFVPGSETIPYPIKKRTLYDLKKARHHLKLSGYSSENPPKIEILYNTSESHKKIAEVAVQMWREALGLEFGLVNFEWKIYLQATKNSEYSIARASWIADYPDPYSFLELGVSTNGNNRTGYNSHEFDDCMNQSLVEHNREKRMETLAHCEEILLEDAPIIPVYYYALNELRKPGLKGAPINPMGMYNWKDVYLESH